MMHYNYFGVPFSLSKRVVFMADPSAVSGAISDFEIKAGAELDVLNGNDEVSDLKKAKELIDQAKARIDKAYLATSQKIESHPEMKRDLDAKRSEALRVLNEKFRKFEGEWKFRERQINFQVRVASFKSQVERAEESPLINDFDLLNKEKDELKAEIEAMRKLQFKNDDLIDEVNEQLSSTLELYEGKKESIRKMIIESYVNNHDESLMKLQGRLRMLVEQSSLSSHIPYEFDNGEMISEMMQQVKFLRGALGGSGDVVLDTAIANKVMEIDDVLANVKSVINPSFKDHDFMSALSTYNGFVKAERDYLGTLSSDESEDVAKNVARSGLKAVKDGMGAALHRIDSNRNKVVRFYAKEKEASANATVLSPLIVTPEPSERKVNSNNNTDIANNVDVKPTVKQNS